MNWFIMFGEILFVHPIFTIGLLLVIGMFLITILGTILPYKIVDKYFDRAETMKPEIIQVIIPSLIVMFIAMMITQSLYGSEEVTQYKTAIELIYFIIPILYMTFIGLMGMRYLKVLKDDDGEKGYY